VRDKHNPLQLVKLYEKIELLASDIVVFPAVFGGGKPRRTAWHGPPVVSRHAQMLVAELVKRVAPPTIAAIQRECANPFHLPRLGARKYLERQVWVERQ
jgi:hypothetical protein